MTIHAILWDLDGTLADTEALHYLAWRDTLAGYGIDHSYEEFRQGFGRTNAAILPGLLGERATPELVEVVAQEKEANFRHLMRQHGLQMLPGVGEWLARFGAAGLPQAVASSGPMVNIVAILDTLGVGGWFDSVISGARLPNGKPDPAIFLLAACSLGADPARCLVLEDSLAGLEAARRANMQSIAVGQVIHQPALHAQLTRFPDPRVILVESLTDLAWLQIGELPADLAD
jgi:HAD superfamily hydrolase (TIGR01509 family)